jgi:RNA polymerase sigma-70 factor (ECF subfamily)
LICVVQVSTLRDQAVAGDEAAFSALVRPHVEAGVRLAYAMLGNRADAEDATQEAVTHAWRRLAQLRDGAAVRPWFLAIVANQSRNLRRTRWFRLVKVPEVQWAEAWREPAEDIDLRRALARLPVTDRQALFLRYYLDLPIEEVAQVLGVTPAAAKVRIHRACRRLRPELREEDL